MVDLSVQLGTMQLKNPVMTASGTFGYGEEFTDFYDVSRIGGIVVKGTTIRERQGNAYPRMAETASGMLNAVGLQNKGVDYFINHIYPRTKELNDRLFVNVSGATIEDYVATAEKLNELSTLPGIELNISCPNVKEGGMAFGTNCISASKVVREVRRVYKNELMVKLSPNVTSVSEIALAVESEGADSVSLINTLMGMAIDYKKRKPILSTITGGLSGPAIKPVALCMVWQVAKVVKIPVVGIGGIMNARDAIEFLLAGASAIQVGTANFINPCAPIEILEGIEEYLIQHGFSSVRELIGALAYE